MPTAGAAALQIEPDAPARALANAAGAADATRPGDKPKQKDKEKSKAIQPAPRGPLQQRGRADGRKGRGLQGYSRGAHVAGVPVFFGAFDFAALALLCATFARDVNHNWPSAGGCCVATRCAALQRIVLLPHRRRRPQRALPPPPPPPPPRPHQHRSSTNLEARRRALSCRLRRPKQSRSQPRRRRRQPCCIRTRRRRRLPRKSLHPRERPTRPSARLAMQPRPPGIQPLPALPP